MWVMLFTVGHFLSAAQGGEKTLPYTENGAVKVYATKAACEQDAVAVARAVHKVDGVELSNRTKCNPHNSMKKPAV